MTILIRSLAIGVMLSACSNSFAGQLGVSAPASSVEKSASATGTFLQVGGESDGGGNDSSNGGNDSSNGGSDSSNGGAEGGA